MKSSFEIHLSRYFIKQVQKLSVSLRKEIETHLTDIQSQFGHPHHSGIGIRRLSKNIFESRLNLSTRIVFEKYNQILFIHFIGNHDEVKRFLKK